MRRIFRVLFLGLLLTGPACLANDQTNALVAAAITNCLQRLEAITTQVTALQQAASNDTIRVTCIADKLNKLKGVVELAQSIHGLFATHVDEDDAVAILNDQAMILSACERAEKLAVAAAECQTGTPPAKAKSRKPPPPPAGPGPAPAPALAPAPVRDANTCLKQAKLAVLLATATGLDTDNPVVAIRELTKRSVEPLDGWDEEECATVDDLCVLVARLFKLKVDAPADPYSYVRAARADGLPVDTLLPRRRQEIDPPLLLEAEVRAFLAAGYAAQPASSRRRQPE